METSQSSQGSGQGSRQSSRQNGQGAPGGQAAGSALAATATLVVGASFTANSVLAHYPYLGGQALRYGIAAVLLALLLARTGVGRGGVAAVRRMTVRLWLRLALLAATGMIGFNVAILAAERTAEPAVPGVLVGCAPLVVAILAPLLAGRRPAARLAAGAGVVAVGAAVVQGLGRTDAAGLGYSVLALVGEVSFALLAVPLLGVLGPVLLSACACAFAAVEAVAVGVLVEGAAWLRLPDGAEAVALGWQAVVVTVVGFVCWYAGMQRIGAERAVLFSGLIPVSAALTAPAVGTGELGVGQIAGSVLVGLGVAVGATSARKRSRPAPEGQAEGQVEGQVGSQAGAARRTKTPQPR